MSKRFPLTPTDLCSLARLVVDATAGVTDLVEEVHDSISHPLQARKVTGSTAGRGVKGLVYGTVRALTGWVGRGVDTALPVLAGLRDVDESSPEREAFLAALNGVVGDHLAATSNPLATSMALRYQDRFLDPTAPSPAGTLSKPGARILILVHGLCCNDRHWTREEHDHGAALARDLGYTPLYLRYNSGSHISTNGKALAELLEGLLDRWPEPVASLAILTHSMGGLVARSACHYAEVEGHSWPGSLSHLIFLGTPHHGSPLERGGHLFDRVLGASPFAGPFARLGKVRSAGITDLRHGNLLDDDWRGQDRFAQGKDTRLHVPLPEGVRSCALAATTSGTAGSLRGQIVGDGLVPLDSALGRHRDPRRCLGFPEDRVWIGHGMNHLDLLGNPEAYEQIRRWLATSGP